jgi:hypothetical protein
MRKPGWLITADILGYFTDKSQDSPAYDPGLSVPCPLCEKPLNAAPRRTHSLMLLARKRSWFFRTHQTCAERQPQALQQIEGEIVDELVAMESPQ